MSMASVVSIPLSTTSVPVSKKLVTTSVGSSVTVGILNQKPIQVTVKPSSSNGSARRFSLQYFAPR